MPRARLGIVALIGLIITFGQILTAQITRNQSVSSRIVITNTTIIDVMAGGRTPGMTVIVRDGRIEQIGRRIAVPRGALRVDGAGKFLIPGLWDMHSHNQASGVDSLDLFVANGVVGTRDMGSDLEFILPLRDRIRRGEVLVRKSSRPAQCWTTLQPSGLTGAVSPTLRRLARLSEI